jgi:hypothetical protein
MEPELDEAYMHKKIDCLLLALRAEQGTRGHLQGVARPESSPFPA